MNNPQKLKQAILKTLAEKGDYTTILAHLSGEEKEEKETKRLNRLIEPLSEFAELMTANTKGVLMENMDKKLSKSTREALQQLADQVNGAIDALQEEINKSNSTTKGELESAYLEKLAEAKVYLEAKVYQMALEIVGKRADELLPELKASGKMTEEEVEQVIMDAALQVESQVSAIIGDYIKETGITTEQITDFEEKVKALIPKYDFSKLTISASQITGLPNFSGAASRNWVEQRLATIGGGGASAFTDLTDVPSSYTGQAGKVVAVNTGEDALEFIAASGVGTVTSVAVSGTDGIEVDSGSPITAAGTITLGVNKANMLSHLNVEDGADVTNTTNVTAAGALMDSEVTNLAAVKAFDPTDYATAAQGTLADSAVQPGDLATVATTGAYSDLSGTPDLTGYQVEPVVVSGSLTASLDVLYHNVASATYTDPSPTEGKGFAVFVRNGTATVGGTGYATAGTIIHRIYHSGAWANYVYLNKAQLDTTYQPLDSDLTTIAAANNGSVLAATTASFTTADESKLDGIEAAADVTDATNVAAAGAVMDGDFGSNGIMERTGAGTYGVVTKPSGALVGISDTQTLTNKRVTPRVGSTTSSATPTINTDNVDAYHLTAQAADITSFTTNLSGTPTDYQKLMISITGTAARAITWGASFENGPVALPTTTVTTTRLDVFFVWNSVTSKWRCMASGSTS